MLYSHNVQFPRLPGLCRRFGPLLSGKSNIASERHRSLAIKNPAALRGQLGRGCEVAKPGQLGRLPRAAALATGRLRL
jgi:hypothetical protein